MVDGSIIPLPDTESGGGSSSSTGMAFNNNTHPPKKRPAQTISAWQEEVEKWALYSTMPSVGLVSALITVGLVDDPKLKMKAERLYKIHKKNWNVFFVGTIDSQEALDKRLAGVNHFFTTMGNEVKETSGAQKALRYYNLNRMSRNGNVSIMDFVEQYLVEVQKVEDDGVSSLNDAHKVRTLFIALSLSEGEAKVVQSHYKMERKEDQHDLHEFIDIVESVLVPTVLSKAKVTGTAALAQGADAAWQGHDGWYEQNQAALDENNWHESNDWVEDHGPAFFADMFSEEEESSDDVPAEKLAMYAKKWQKWKKNFGGKSNNWSNNDWNTGNSWNYWKKPKGGKGKKFGKNDSYKSSGKSSSSGKFKSSGKSKNGWKSGGKKYGKGFFAANDWSGADWNDYDESGWCEEDWTPAVESS